MNTEKLTQLQSLLDLADKKASAATYNLNTLEMRITVPPRVQVCIDNECSAIKGAINDLLAAKAIVSDLQKPDDSGSLVCLWLLIPGDKEIDYLTPPFVWPFKELPRAGDRIDTNSLIKHFAPELPAEFLTHDYFVMQYSFFDLFTYGYAQCLKLMPA